MSFFEASKKRNFESGPKSVRGRKTFEIENYLIECEQDGMNDLSISGQTVVKNKKTNLTIFHGLYFRSEKNGYGIQYDEKEVPIYEGEHRNNQREGWGKTPNYEGQFKNDLCNGWGRFTNANEIYQGYFLNSKFNGVGIHIKGNEKLKHIFDILEKKNLYEFIIKKLQKERASFLEEFSIESVYIGEWMDGLQHGFGKMWSSQSIYSGQYARGQEHGNGALITEGEEQKIKKGTFVLGTFKN